MEAPSSSLLAADNRRSWIGPALVGVLSFLAYRTLLAGAFAASYDLERWLFRPSPLPPLAALAVAGWLLWKRRDRLRALPDRRAPVGAAALATVGGGLFIWALLTRTADLFLPSLSLNLLAFAAASRGWGGCRAVLLPALVLMLSTPIPTPLRNEIVWQLQVWATTASGWLLETIGREFFQGGVILRNEEHTFHVIDGCSGMNGIKILTLIALIVRELFEDSGRRQWLLVACAPVLGFALNAVRVVYIAASPDPEALAGADGDHTGQGVAVLVVGTGILYALGWAMARRTTPGRTAGSSPPPEEAVRAAPWGPAATGLAILALLTLVLPRFETPARSQYRAVEFPLKKFEWVGERTRSDPLFLGVVPGAVHRRYAIAGEREHALAGVDLFIGFERADLPGTSQLLSSKLALPGPAWDLVRQRRERLWVLDREADLTLAAPGRDSERAVVYTWRLRDEGLWRESWRSFLALEQSPFRREGRRAVVRMVAYAPHDGQLVLDQAKQRLDRFIVAFREELATL